MKKLISFVMTLVLMSLIVANCAPALPASGTTLTLIVSYDQNAMFSIYDVDIYLDDLYIDTILQGKKMAYTISDVSTNTPHTLYFYKSTDHDMHDADRHMLRFELNGTSEINCNIEAHWYGVVINSHSQTGESTSHAPAYGTSTFAFKITNESNLMMATYPIEVYIDDMKITTVSNGYSNSDTLELENGKHTLYFYKQGGHSICSPLNIVISGDTRFSCHLKAHMNYIEIKDINTNASVQ